MSNEPARRQSTHTGKSIRPRRWLVLAMRRKRKLLCPLPPGYLLPAMAIRQPLCETSPLT